MSHTLIIFAFLRVILTSNSIPKSGFMLCLVYRISGCNKLDLLSWLSCTWQLIWFLKQRLACNTCIGVNSIRNYRCLNSISANILAILRLCETDKQSQTTKDDWNFYSICFALRLTDSNRFIKNRFSFFNWCLKDISNIKYNTD